MKTLKLKRDDISIDGGTQQREKIDPAVVAEYAESMRCGATFPPISVFFDGAQTWLADGFHRFHARGEAEIDDILCDVYEGTNRDALLFSAGANAVHGLRPTNADKRKSVMVLLNDEEWSHWTDSKISIHCKVTQPFVSKLRKNEADSKIITVIIPPLKPALNLRMKIDDLGKSEELSTDEAENLYSEADAHEDAMQGTISALSDENEILLNQLAAKLFTGSEEERTEYLGRLNFLTEENKQLKILNNGLIKARDSVMRENSSMRKQLTMNAKKMKA